MAFFGEVKNIRINYSSYLYEDTGVEIGRYDSLKDAVLTIKSSELVNYSGFFVHFEDGRGAKHIFLIGDEMVENREVVELISGLSALEKTPSPYTAYDISLLSNYIGMTPEEFDASIMMEHAEKEVLEGMYDQYIIYTLDDFINGIQIIYSAPSTNNIITECRIIIIREIYDTLPMEEKFSFLGVDFDMTEVVANYHVASLDSLSIVYAWGGTPDSIIREIDLSK